MIKTPALWSIPNIDKNDEQSRLPKLKQILNQRLQYICQSHKNIKFASSLAAEDMVINDALSTLGADIEVFTLDTGKLNPETTNLITEVKERYPQLRFCIYHPDSNDVANYIKQNGENAFYNSIALRRECCQIRKIEPLNRALNDADAWLTGQRKEQSITRNSLAFAETDQIRGIAKYNPIYDWLESDIWAYVQTENLPYNSLYSKGYPSIGCEPCTMPVKFGEDIRSGRWWWESRDSKECGLHK